MGTNYYLHRKPDLCGECGRDKNEPNEFHIGKSSMGWVWLWQGYRNGAGPGVDLTRPDEWFSFLVDEVAKGAEICDEYSQVVTLDELRTRVVSKRGGRANGVRDWTEHVDGDDVSFNDFC